MRARTSVVAALSLAALLVPLPAPGLGAPATLQRTLHLGGLAGTSPAVPTPFPIDFLGLSWRTGREPEVRFLLASGGGAWRKVEREEISTGGGVHARLIGGGDAHAFQVRALNGGLEATILNTTDGPRRPSWGAPAEASHRPEGTVVSRIGWGADESLRFTNGSEEAPQIFFPVQKIVVHHTATDPAAGDPAATVRAIYAYHAGAVALGDIAYHFVIAPDGTVYKGRYSGPVGTTARDTITGEDPGRRLVRGAHVELNNSGTMGIALLGDFSTSSPTAEARAALVSLLAWAVERHGLDTEATDTFVNPSSGETKDVPEISGHRAWKATACPGDVLDADLPAIRHEVALAVGPRIDAGLSPTQLARTFTVAWGWGATAATSYSLQVRTARFDSGARSCDDPARRDDRNVDRVHRRARANPLLRGCGHGHGRCVIGLGGGEMRGDPARRPRAGQDGDLAKGPLRGILPEDVPGILRARRGALAAPRRRRRDRDRRHEVPRLRHAPRVPREAAGGQDPAEGRLTAPRAGDPRRRLRGAQEESPPAGRRFAGPAGADRGRRDPGGVSPARPLPQPLEGFPEIGG